MTKKRLLPFTEQKNYRPISDDGSFGGRSLVLGYVHFVKQEQRRVRWITYYFGERQGVGMFEGRISG